MTLLASSTSANAARRGSVFDTRLMSPRCGLPGVAGLRVDAREPDHGREPTAVPALPPGTLRPLRVTGVECFEVTGGAALTGRVRVTGAKNSALKLMAAALLAAGPTTIDEVPDILDVAIMSEVLRRLGCDVTYERTGDGGGGGRVVVDVPEKPSHGDRLRPRAPDAGVDQRARPAGRPLRHGAGGPARR